jgi:hypothetical protein
MSRDTTVLPFRQREAIDDPLSELAREGARRTNRVGSSGSCSDRSLKSTDRGNARVSTVFMQK